MTAATLKALTLKDLAQIAKRKGVRGWQTMRKEQLVKALAPKAAAKSTPVNGKKRPATSRSQTSSATAVNRTKTNKKSVVSSKSAPRPKPKSPAVARRIGQAKTEQRRLKNLAFRTPAGKPEGYARDRLVVMVRDPYWLHAYWEITRHGVVRAEAALAQEWHASRAVLRLLDVSSNSTTSAAERVIRDIDIHGGVNNWYIDLNDSPRTYRVDIGYLAPSGKFYTLARSNVVSTPKAAASSELDENWSDVAENFDKIFAMSGGYSPEINSSELQELFEERLRRPMGSPVMTRYGAGGERMIATPRKKEFQFEVDAEMIVYGRTESNAHVMLQGEPVQLRPDGTFTVRVSMPNCRQVIPAVASSADGVEQRTVVLAVERNTKTMEPVTRDTTD
ncbi:MAG: DUF4912 domain-containing protein [Pirellulales bacterium]|nr:DUF4912 domain-containing protein [Pirellulales bacterium]